MKLNKMPKDELELYSYVDLSKMILKEKKKAMNTPTLFHEICNLLEMSEEEYADKIGDFYTSLTTDKGFVLLDDGNWDLRDNHPTNIVLDDDEEEEEELEEEVHDEEVLEDEEPDEIDEDSLDDDDEEDDEEIGDLRVLTDEELDD